MKNKAKTITVLTLLALSLSACNLSFLQKFTNKDSSESSESSSIHLSSESSSSSSELSSSQSESSSESSESQSSETPKPTGKTTIEIYATNDIHGAVMEEYDRMGISKLGTYLKGKKENPNTLLLDQGDTWQGSIYSNYNHGGLITDVMNYIHYDARSVGNHDFDWGLEYIENNTKRSFDGYSVPVLAGNVYDFNFDTKEIGDTQQSQLGTSSVTYVLDNGVKVGILGGIGDTQITSINSIFTTDITFINHINFIKNEANYLRNVEKCDVVIASIHTGQEEVLHNNLANYVDLVLCGHTHRQEYTMEDGVCFVQSKAYSQSMGHITLTYDYDLGEVTKTSLEYITASTVKNAVSTIDPVIQEIVNTYNTECDSEANQVVASHVTGSFYSSEELPNLMCRAILETCIAEGIDDVFLSYTNNARASLYNTSWTYADLYQAFPFDNMIFIMNITGEELLREIASYNFICRNSAFTENEIDPNGTYKIAAIDYLCFHTNEERYYDYFPVSGGTYETYLDNNYRVVLKNWLSNNGYGNEKVLVSGNFSSSVWEHDRTVFTQA